MESNKKIIEYDIIISRNIKDINKGLISLVNQKIKKGWIPLGGVLLDTSLSGPLFYQTMIKYETIKYN